MNPEMAAEATLQPLQRFDLDAAIIFSDILVIPQALGQRVSFEEGKGPLLEPITEGDDLSGLTVDGLERSLGPVYEALARVREALSERVALIGFAGAPWTLATYMIEGGTSRDFAKVKAFAYRDPETFGRLIDMLSDAVTRHLIKQVEAGAEAVQIFDSWAGVLPIAEFHAWCLTPTAEILSLFKQSCPEVPMIAFPRGAGLHYADFARLGGLDGVSIDTTVPPAWAAESLQPRIAVQGNLDPVRLMVGGTGMTAAVEQIVGALSAGRFIFNLGHGVLPGTPPAHVEALIATVRANQ